MRKYLNVRTNIALGLIFAFLLNSLGPMPLAQAQEFRLPAPGMMVYLSPTFNPPILKGLKVHPDNPFRFDFILDKGDNSSPNLKEESTKLIKYFMASLTIPEQDLWVNLSPYEKNRIVPDAFGKTEMGRDLLAEDYMLKQITASLIYPEGETGKKFWKLIYEEAAHRFGTTNIPINTFNKVWIVPEKAVVYENAKAGTAYVVESKLKVMLEQDYLAFEKNQSQPGDMFKSELQGTCPQAGCQASKPSNAKAPQGTSLTPSKNINALGSQIVREIVIPELTKEVNEDKNFSQLRQVYNSLILATWYKKKIKDSILAQVYENKKKVAGILSSPNVLIGDPQQIYQRYLEAFKRGAYNYIKEEVDPVSQQTVPRKYFSGGMWMEKIGTAMSIEPMPEDFKIEAKDIEIDAAMSASRQMSPTVRAVLKKLLTSEYIEGQTLEQKAASINEADFESQVLAWFVDITEALAYLESEGRLHGDITAENIIIEEKTNLPVIIDWNDPRNKDDVGETIKTIKSLLLEKGLEMLSVEERTSDSLEQNVINASKHLYSDDFNALLNETYPNMESLHEALKRYQTMNADLQWPEPNVTHNSIFDQRMLSYFIPWLSGAIRKVSSYGPIDRREPIAIRRYESLFKQLIILSEELGIKPVIVSKVNELKSHKMLALVSLGDLIDALNESLLKHGWLIDITTLSDDNKYADLLWDKIAGYREVEDQDGQKVFIILADDFKRESNIGKSILGGRMAVSMSDAKTILLSKALTSDEEIEKRRQGLLGLANSGLGYFSANIRNKLRRVGKDEFSEIFKHLVLLEEWTHVQDKKRVFKALRLNPHLSYLEIISTVLSFRSSNPFVDLVSKKWMAYALELQRENNFNPDTFLNATIELRAILEIFFQISLDDEFTVQLALLIRMLLVYRPPLEQYLAYAVPVKYVFWGLEESLGFRHASDPLMLNNYAFLSGNNAYQRIRRVLGSADGAMNGMDQVHRYLEDMGNEQSEINKFLGFLSQPNKVLVLEIGAGNTHVALALARNNPDANIAATDIFNPSDYTYFIAGQVFNRRLLPAQVEKDVNVRKRVSVLRAGPEIIAMLPKDSIDHILLVNPTNTAAIQIIGADHVYANLARLKTGGSIVIKPYQSKQKELIAADMNIEEYKTGDSMKAVFMGVDLQSVSGYGGHADILQVQKIAGMGGQNDVGTDEAMAAKEVTLDRLPEIFRRDPLRGFKALEGMSKQQISSVFEDHHMPPELRMAALRLRIMLSFFKTDAFQRKDILELSNILVEKLAHNSQEQDREIFGSNSWEHYLGIYVLAVYFVLCERFGLEYNRGILLVIFATRFMSGVPIAGTAKLQFNTQFFVDSTGRRIILLMAHELMHDILGFDYGIGRSFSSGISYDRHVIHEWFGYLMMLALASQEGWREDYDYLLSAHLKIMGARNDFNGIAAQRLRSTFAEEEKKGNFLNADILLRAGLDVMRQQRISRIERIKRLSFSKILPITLTELINKSLARYAELKSDADVAMVSGANADLPRFTSAASVLEELKRFYASLGYPDKRIQLTIALTWIEPSQHSRATTWDQAYQLMNLIAQTVKRLSIKYNQPQILLRLTKIVLATSDVDLLTEILNDKRFTRGMIDAFSDWIYLEGINKESFEKFLEEFTPAKSAKGNVEQVSDGQVEEAPPLHETFNITKAGNNQFNINLIYDDPVYSHAGYNFYPRAKYHIVPNSRTLVIEEMQADNFPLLPKENRMRVVGWNKDILNEIIKRNQKDIDTIIFVAPLLPWSLWRSNGMNPVTVHRQYALFPYENGFTLSTVPNLRSLGLQASSLVWVKKVDHAQLVNYKNGGIDLSSDKALIVQNSGQGIKFHIDPAQLQELEDASGFVPVIIRFKPLTNVRAFLGV